MPQNGPDPSNVTITIAACCGVGLLIAGVAISMGVQEGRLEAQPAFTGLAVLVFANVLLTLLVVTPTHRSSPELHGSIAVGLVAMALGLGLLFGPLNPLVLIGIPCVGVITLRRLGHLWGRAVTGFGSVGALVLTGLVWAEVVPRAAAWAEPPVGDPVRDTLAGLALVMGGVLGMTYLPPVLPEVPQTATGRPPMVRTRSFSERQVEQMSVERYTPEDMAALTEALTTEPAAASRIDETLELQKLESLGVLAGGIAHDFNNLLMSILGNSSLALMEAGDNKALLQPVREIEIAAKRARDLVGQLLAYAGKGTVSTTPLDLNTLVQEMGDLLATAGSRRAAIDYAFCEAVPLIIADPTQVRQIVMNLITNAADAMGNTADARIVVTTRIQHLDRAALDDTILGITCEPAVYVMLSVQDHGCGMDEATLSRIFDPFYTTKKTGRGLGLAAVLGIVRRYGGTMQVESVLDEGTTFRIYFPYAEAMDEDEDLPTEQTSTAQGWAASVETGAILVVDDDPVVLKVTTRMVERLNFDVLEANDGEHAVEVFTAQEPRVLAVIIDMTMPGMDGVETLNAIRAIRADTPVILTSGYSEADIPKTEAVFLQKPYTMKQLTKALDRVFE